MLGEHKYKKYPGKKSYKNYNYDFDYNYDYRSKNWFNANKTKKFISAKAVTETSDIEIMNGILKDLGINSYNITQIDMDTIANKFFDATGENIKEDYLNELIIDSEAYNAPDTYSKDYLYD